MILIGVSFSYGLGVSLPKAVSNYYIEKKRID